MALYAKHLVSKKKRRFIEDGFDLDMTFITKNIVAMGFPAEGREGIYRNNMRDVKRFFDSRHRDHYKVYNLCSERDYDPDKFYGRVAKYPFDDHNAPPFVLIGPFCNDVQTYLAEDPRNVAVIHCKAGKGRTGVMICAYLVHCGLWDDIQGALEFYGHARTMNGKGVTIPSQVRYVTYYARYIRERLTYVPKPLLLTKIVLKGIPDFSNGTCVPQFTLKQGTVHTFKSGWYEEISRDQPVAELTLSSPTPVAGDVKLEFIHKKSTGKEKMFHLWFNTFFIEDLKMVATQPEIDKANKDKKNKIYPVGFKVELHFAEISDSSKGAEGKVTQIEDGAATDSLAPKPRLAHSKSTLSQAPEFSDSDLTTTDDEDDEWEGLPISDV
eukprot:m.355172 g.355172  ORF g.355172 m.355172 type:complete len:382 (-) comp17189_c0_seq1:517-1662(-)